MKINKILLNLFIILNLAGCFAISGRERSTPIPERPDPMLEYYKPHSSYLSYQEDVTAVTSSYIEKHILVTTTNGSFQIDLFENQEPDDDLVFVFPVLGGKNFVERSIAIFLAEHGVDTAIVNRNNEFKDPKKFDNLEEILRQNLIRDRLAIDFFEREYGKRDFGSFGISRGGINVALTAGVDSRLKYNVMVLGGTDMVNVFRDSDQKRIQKYVSTVSTEKNIAEEEFYELLKRDIITDPINTAHYINGDDSLLILAIFDKTVPFSYGMRLREQLGYPKTIFLFSDHYVGLLYTQVGSLIPPGKGPGLFPFPYIEDEALNFFRDKFKTGETWGLVPFKIFQAPLNLIGEVVSGVVGGIDDLVEDQNEVHKGVWDK